MAKAAAGAAKTGASVSGTAAGTALAGPLGMLIGTLATSKTFWRIIGAIFLTIFLLMYLIANSVGIIMSYLGFGSPGQYVDEARQAEYQAIKAQLDTLFSDADFREEIEGILEQSRDQKLDEIEADFDANWDGYDDFEVEDEYETILLPKLSQYLAVLMEETWSGSQITGFTGYGGFGAVGTNGDLGSEYDEYFTLAASTYQVPEALLKAMAKVESDFNPDAVSSAGAVGIMQLMPSTAKGLGVEDPYDPKQNIMGGAKYVAELYRTFGAYSNGLELVIAAYNSGPETVKKAGYQIPQNSETPNHVKKVMSYLTFPGEGSGVSGDFWGTAQGTADTEISELLLKELVETKGSEFLGWTVSGTHTETIGSDDDEEEIEIVDYTICVLLNPTLSDTPTDYGYRYVTSQTSFQAVLSLFQLLEDGKDGIDTILYLISSWKNFVVGEGAAEDVFTSGIETGGDQIEYETVLGCVTEVTYYNQAEEPWASHPFGSSDIHDAGCGPVALAIAISTLTGDAVTPQMTADFAMDQGDYVSGLGTSHAYPTHAAQNWGLEVERVTRDQMGKVVEKLKEGCLAVVICAENTISGSSGHFIVLTGVTEDGYLTIADPGSRARTGNLYSPQTIQSYARNLADGSIWIMGEAA